LRGDGVADPLKRARVTERRDGNVEEEKAADLEDIIPIGADTL
jgi:hypothetical protein